VSRNSLIVLMTAALGVAACGKSKTPETTVPSDGGAPHSDAPVAAASASEPDDGTSDLEADPDSADDWDPEAGGSDYVAEADAGPVSPVEDPRADLTEPTEMATVTIEIKGNGGKVRKSSPQYVQWKQLTRIPVDFEGQIHEFDLELSKSSASSLGVVISYTLGAEDVLRDYKFDTKPKFREVLRIDNGTALAITITPKTVKPYTKKEREKLEGGAEKDPLAGAKKK
jgi:hypothetical protein